MITEQRIPSAFKFDINLNFSHLFDTRYYFVTLRCLKRVIGHLLLFGDLIMIVSFSSRNARSCSPIAGKFRYGLRPFQVWLKKTLDLRQQNQLRIRHTQHGLRCLFTAGVPVNKICANIKILVFIIVYYKKLRIQFARKMPPKQHCLFL